MKLEYEATLNTWFLEDNGAVQACGPEENALFALFCEFYYTNPTKHYWDVFTSVKGTHVANYFFKVPDMSRASGWTYQLT